MPGFKRIFQTSKAPEKSRGAQPQRGEPIRIIAITDSQEDWEHLREICGSSGWDLSVTGSADGALELLKEQPPPLVICDRDLPGQNWKDVLMQIACLPQVVCVLLASNVIDQYLWDEVIRHRGYDVVRKPFQRDELSRIIRFAWSWQGWAAAHQAKLLGKLPS